MREAPIPENDEQRIAALRELDLLDTAEEERFDRITRLAQRMFGTPIALVSLIDRERQWFKSRQGLDATETPRGISFCGHAILDDQAFVVNDTREDDRFMDNPLVTNDPNIRFYAGYPISAPDGSKIGTLCIIDSEPRTFSDDDVQLLSDLGRTVEEEIVARSIATRDELTELSNRRGFLEVGRKSLAICRRARTPATLLYFDLNEFKQVNDTHGHAAGDAALRNFARLLMDAFRESDVTARVGGDEFCVLMTGTDAAHCAMAIGRFRALLAQHNEQSGVPYGLEFSFGMVEFVPDEHASIDDLVAAADERMLQMKRAGRDAKST